MKTIYEFTIKQEVEVDKVETREENGATVTVTTKVKEERPLVVGIKKPSRNDREECEIVRDVAFKKFIERGIITEANLRKQYGESGGVYTTEEEIHYANSREKLRGLILDYQEAALDESEEGKKKATELFSQIFSIRQQIIDFERTASLFYERTAEAKAQKKAIEYYLLHLTHTRAETADSKWEPFFKGDDKYTVLAKLEDDEDKTYLALRDRVLLVLTLLANSPDITRDQLKQEVE